MVSEDSHSDSHSSILHQFIISTSMTNNPNNFETQPFNNANYPQSMHFLGEAEINQNRRRLMDLLGTSNENENEPAAATQQRLSLSLNSSLVHPENYFIPGNTTPFPQTSLSQNESFITEIESSKYLKPAQAVLLEMVSVENNQVHLINQKFLEKFSRRSRKGSLGLYSELKQEFSSGEVLTDINYISLLKLISLLEEVERRYEEYYLHLEELISSFEMIAGLGTGKSYTALALQAMSKHFGNLRNAILSQIRVTKEKISSEPPKLSSRLSRLSMVDRNRISLHQIGIMQSGNQAWRPIRGLPEASVTILRAWLFEHFLHPYPTDPEKLMLSSQTGLSKNQVSNWFINARVRLWKPMIEEMYKEELADSSVESDLLLTSSSPSREGVGDSAEDLS